MPSTAVQCWRTTSARALDEIEAAHAAVGGTGPGRRYATRQINQAYTVLLSSQFQRFCRDLHTEAVDFFLRHAVAAAPPAQQSIVRERFTEGRKLGTGNPNPANIGSDFARLGMDLWPAVAAHAASNRVRKLRLEELNRWRNAVAHQDFDPLVLGGRTEPRLSQVRAWRSACDGLALCLDDVVADYLAAIIGTRPW